MTRKEFIKKSLMAFGSLMFLPRIVYPLLGQRTIRNLQDLFNNKTVVLINLSGGNDGLNTVIPYSNDNYYNLRPSIGIDPSSVLALNNDLGLHPELSELYDFWQLNKLAIIENVGYNSQNLSHFRSTDIWRSGSNSNEVVTTGWVARYIEQVVQDIHTNPPQYPSAFQIGNSNTLQLTGNNGLTGVLVDDPETFYQLVNETYDDLSNGENDLNTYGKQEVEFIRQISTLSFNYADVIQSASLNGQNTVNYANTSPARDLKIIAKLISGGLYSPFYLVHQGGYDTHDNQLYRHDILMNNLSSSISSFITDLHNQGLHENIVVMTTSEFGRRPFENGAFGTDHGTSAPHFLVGNNINSSIIGGNPNLSSFDNNQNLHHTIDYRQIFTSLITEWFGHSQNIANTTFNGSFEPLGLF